MEFESFQDGTLLYIGVETGAPVDSILCVLGEEGEEFQSLIDEDDVQQLKKKRLQRQHLLQQHRQHQHQQRLLHLHLHLRLLQQPLKLQPQLLLQEMTEL